MAFHIGEAKYKAGGPELKLLYRLCFGKVGKQNVVKKHLRLFTGFADDKGKTKAESVANGVKLSEVKVMLGLCDQDTGGKKDEMVERLADDHANARAFVDHVRNKPDDALDLIAGKGGVIGANAFPPFLRKGFESTVRDYVDAIDDLVERVGIDHVGIGTDFTQDQPAAFFDWLLSQHGTKPLERPMGFPDTVVHPEEMETPDRLSSVARELSDRGYGEADLRKVLGGNWLRLFRQIWGA